MTCRLYESFRRIRNKGTSLSLIQVDDLEEMKREVRGEIVKMRRRREDKEVQRRRHEIYAKAASREATNCVQADTCCAGHEVARLSWSLKLHDRVNKSQPLAPVLIQMPPAHYFTPYAFKIRSNTIPSPILTSLNCPLTIRFPHNNFTCISLPCMLHIAPLSFLI